MNEKQLLAQARKICSNFLQNPTLDSFLELQRGLVAFEHKITLESPKYKANKELIEHYEVIIHYATADIEKLRTYDYGQASLSGRFIATQGLEISLHGSTLEQLKDSCISELNEAIKEIKTEGTTIAKSYDDLQERIREITDSNTPIYYSDIDALYYLHGDEFEEALENAGMDIAGQQNRKQIAISLYLESILSDHLRDKEEEEKEQD